VIVKEAASNTRNRVYLVTTKRIRDFNDVAAMENGVSNWIFARGKTQAAAAFALAHCLDGLCLSCDTDNPEAPYVYNAKIKADGLRAVLGDDDYEFFVREMLTYVVKKDDPLHHLLLHLARGETVTREYADDYYIKNAGKIEEKE